MSPQIVTRYWFFRLSETSKRGELATINADNQERAARRSQATSLAMVCISFQ